MVPMPGYDDGADAYDPTKHELLKNVPEYGSADSHAHYIAMASGVSARQPQSPLEQRQSEVTAQDETVEVTMIAGVCHKDYKDNLYEVARGKINATSVHMLLQVG